MATTAMDESWSDVSQDEDIPLVSPSPPNTTTQSAASASPVPARTEDGDESVGYDDFNFTSSDTSGDSGVSDYSRPNIKRRKTRSRRKDINVELSSETDGKVLKGRRKGKKPAVVIVSPTTTESDESMDDLAQDDDFSDVMLNWEDIEVFTASGRPPIVPFDDWHSITLDEDGRLIGCAECVEPPVGGFPKCYGMVAAPAERVNPADLGLLFFHQPLERRKLNAYADVPMADELVEAIAAADQDAHGFVEPLGSRFTLDRHDPRYVSGTRYLTEYNVETQDAEDARMKRMTLPKLPGFEYDANNVLRRQAIPGAHAMVAGVPYVLQVNHPSHPEYATYPVTIACYHTLASLRAVLDSNVYDQLLANVKRYCELMWGTEKRMGLVDIPLKPNDRTTRGERKAKKAAGSKASKSRLPDLPVQREADFVKVEEQDVLDFVPPARSARERLQGPLSASIAGTIINTGSGIFAPAVQDLQAHMKALLWETLIILRYFYLTIVPLCVSHFEWQNVQFYYLDQNVFSFGGSGPGPVSVQLNRSNTYNTWATLESLVDEITRCLEESIGFQGRLHGDAKDDCLIQTLCALTFRFANDAEGHHYAGAFHMPRHGLYIAELELLICFLIFNARDLHGGEAPGHVRVVVERTLNMLPEKELLLTTWKQVGRFNRICAVLYTSTQVMNRVAPTQVSPSNGYANQGATPTHQHYVQSYAQNGLHLMGDMYDRELRLMTERVYADTTTAFWTGGEPFVTLEDGLEKVHRKFGGSRRGEISLSSMAWSEIFLRRRMLQFFRELCESRLLSVVTEDLRKMKSKLMSASPLFATAASTSSPLPKTHTSPRLILPNLSGATAPDAIRDPTTALALRSSTPPRPEVSRDTPEPSSSSGAVMSGTASDTTLPGIICVAFKGYGRKVTFQIQDVSGLHWLNSNEIVTHGYTDVVRTYCQDHNLRIPHVLSAQDNGLPAYLKLRVDLLDSYVDPDSFTKDFDTLTSMETFLTASGGLKNNNDLSVFAIRLAKERRQWDERRDSAESASGTVNLSALRFATYELDFLEACTSALVEDTQVLGKIEILKRVSTAAIARAHLFIYTWIESARSGCIKVLVDSLWTSWDSGSALPTNLARRSSCLTIVVWQIQLAVLDNCLETNPRSRWTEDSTFSKPSKGALADAWTDYRKRLPLASKDWSRLPHNLYGALTRVPSSVPAPLVLPTWNKIARITKVAVANKVVDVLCTFIETQFIFPRTGFFDEHIKRAVSPGEKSTERIRCRTLLRGEILTQMVDNYEGQGVLYTDLVHTVLLRPEDILHSPSRAPNLVAKISTGEFPSLFPNPPPSAVLSRLAEIQKLTEHCLDLIATKGTLKSLTVTADGLLTSESLRRSTLPWENSVAFASRWEMVSVMVMESLAFDAENIHTSCAILAHHSFLGGTVKKGQEIIEIDIDSIHPFRALNPMTSLIREYYTSPSAFTRDTGLPELLIFHIHGHGYGTKDALKLLKPPYDSLPRLISAFSKHYNAKISNPRVWGTASAGMMHTERRKRPGRSLEKRKSATRKDGTLTQQAKSDLIHRLTRYWSTQAIEEWHGFMETHKMLNVDPTTHSAKRPSWRAFYALMKKLALPGFSKKTLTLLQLGNTLTILDLIEPPTLMDTVRLVIGINRGGVAGLRFLGFPCRNDVEIAAAFVAFYRWCSSHLTEKERSRVRFNPNVAENLLCKIGRWVRKTAGSDFPLMTTEWLDNVRETVEPWTLVDTATLDNAIKEARLMIL